MGTQRDFVASGHGIHRCDQLVIEMKSIAYRHVSQGDGDGVTRVKTQQTGGRGRRHGAIVTGVIR